MSVRDMFGMACPQCGSDAHLKIYIHTWAPLSEDGTDSNDSEHIWDEDDDCCCVACGIVRQVKEFVAENGDTAS